VNDEPLARLLLNQDLSPRRNKGTPHAGNDTGTTRRIGKPLPNR
jgi:hypothetical protein